MTGEGSVESDETGNGPPDGVLVLGWALLLSTAASAITWFIGMRSISVAVLQFGLGIVAATVVVAVLYTLLEGVAGREI